MLSWKKRRFFLVDNPAKKAEQGGSELGVPYGLLRRAGNNQPIVQVSEDHDTSPSEEGGHRSRYSRKDMRSCRESEWHSLEYIVDAFVLEGQEPLVTEMDGDVQIRIL